MAGTLYPNVFRMTIDLDMRHPFLKPKTNKFNDVMTSYSVTHLKAFILILTNVKCKLSVWNNEVFKCFMDCHTLSFAVNVSRKLNSKS